MPRECPICGKRGMMARRLKKLRGKYNPTIKRRQHPNLQRVRVPIEIKKQAFKKFAGKQVLMCTKCRKTMLKPK